MNGLSIHNFRKSVYLRILILFAAIMTGVLLITVPVNMRSRARSHDQYIESTQQKAKYFLDMLSYEINMTQNRLLNLINDPSLNELSSYSRVDYTLHEIKLILSVKSSLAGIADQSRYVKEATVYLPRQGRKIDTHFSYEPLEAGLYESLLQQVSEGRQPFLESDGRWFTGYARYFQGREDSEYTFLVVIEWDQDRLRQTLKSFSTLERDGSDRVMSGAMFVGDFGGITLSDASPDVEVDAFFSDHVRNATAAQGSGRLQYRGGSWIYVWNNSSTLHAKLLVYENESLINGFLSFYRQSIALVIAFAVLSAAGYAFVARHFIAKPLRELKEAFLRFEREYLSPPEESVSGNDFHQLFAYFHRMVERTDELIDQLYNQRILVQKAQLKQLQSQINPHFLYNSLLCARSQIKMGDDQGAVDMLRHLAGYYEYITREGRDEVMLCEEIKHASNYIGVQSVRFANRLTVHFNPPPEDCLQCMVPRLILQPLVENAFTHGFSEKPADAMLRLEIRNEGRFLTVEVEDNGAVSDDQVAQLCARLGEASPSAEVSGLINVHRRLVYRFGGASGLSFRRGALNGLCVTLTIEREAENV